MENAAWRNGITTNWQKWNILRCGLNPTSGPTTLCYIYIYHTYTLRYIYIYAHYDTSVYIYDIHHISKISYSYVYIYIGIHTIILYIYTYMHACIHTLHYITNITLHYIYIYIYIHTYIHIDIISVLLVPSCIHPPNRFSQALRWPSWFVPTSSCLTRWCTKWERMPSAMLSPEQLMRRTTHRCRASCPPLLRWFYREKPMVFSCSPRLN